MGGRGRGAREEINAKLDSNQKTTCVLCFVFFYGGEKEGAVINGNRVWGPDTNSTQLMGKKAHREKKKTPSSGTRTSLSSSDISPRVIVVPRSV